MKKNEQTNSQTKSSVRAEQSDYQAHQLGGEVALGINIMLAIQEVSLNKHCWGSDTEMIGQSWIHGMEAELQQVRHVLWVAMQLA